ncbi:hypothetical protein [Paraburkholderia xenovorans]|uniref:hypothetical protein n=1 Tax=Paraburkholderia xenovorans TaxID=36873 RepID=UPI0015C580E3|nr:hypothetical protein [Paraburkholderia xenovorans]NPT39069.1 hypothetical protein [Paraburkholderia xenovorans]
MTAPCKKKARPQWARLGVNRGSLTLKNGKSDKNSIAKAFKGCKPLQQRIPMPADAGEAATIRSPSACRHLDSRCRANFSLTRINILSKVVKVPPVVLSRLIGSLGPPGER